MTTLRPQAATAPRSSERGVAASPEPPDDYWLPLGLGDLAVVAGVPVDTVKKWFQRARVGTLKGELPPSPRWRVNVGKTPLWSRGEWIAWLTRTGRLRA